MEPIVSPWFIYCLSLVTPIIGVLIFVAGAVAITGMLFGICLAVNSGEYWAKDREKIYKAWKAFHPKLFISIGVIALLLVIFIPSRNTIIAMYAADKITYNNVQKAVDAGKTIKDSLKQDVIDIIQTIQREPVAKK